MTEKCKNTQSTHRVAEGGVLNLVVTALEQLARTTAVRLLGIRDDGTLLTAQRALVDVPRSACQRDTTHTRHRKGIVDYWWSPCVRHATHNKGEPPAPAAPTHDPSHATQPLEYYIMDRHMHSGAPS